MTQEKKLDTLIAALKEIIDGLGLCATPCNWKDEPEKCSSCGHKRSKQWCCSCIANEALQAIEINYSPTEKEY